MSDGGTGGAAGALAGLRGPHGAAGKPRARRLPVTGPADVARRLHAVRAKTPAPVAFTAAAAMGWAEWPAVLPLPTGDQVAVGPDRTLLAGDLEALAARWRRAVPELAAWVDATPAPPRAVGAPEPLRCGPFALRFGVKTYVVGIVNRTPNSFSDGDGVLPTVDASVAAVWAAYRAGADVVDIGAESSEERDQGGIDPEEEAARLVPVLQGLEGLPALVSVDTRRGSVARRALGLRPVMVNDVDAGADPDLVAAVGAAGAPVVLMHSAPVPAGRDPVAIVRERLRSSLARAGRAGITPEQVVVDAGFGFGTTIAQDLEVTRRLGELRALGRPILHAPSRKHAIGAVLAFPDTIAERLAGTAAAVVVGIGAGADFVRVHDVAHMARVARMADAICRGAGWADVTAP